MTEDEEEEIKEKACESTHKGFIIMCSLCKSNLVEYYSDMGYSPTSGAWGGTHLRCLECGHELTLSGD